MHDCTVTAKPGASAITVAVVGHCAAALPRPVEQAAAAIAKGEGACPQMLATDKGRFLLVKPDPKPWLVGGEEWRVLGGQIANAVRDAKATSATVLVGGRQARAAELVEGVVLGDYRFNLLRSGKEGERPRLTVRVPGQAEAVAAGVRAGEAQNLARELADLPGNLLNPQAFAARARQELRGTGLAVSVISGCRALLKAGFPGLVQVGRAGSTEPALVEIRWRPRRGGRKHLALVGKGLTFDSGGISLKPGDRMWEMKGDKSGAAAVLAAMKLVAAAEPDNAVTGYLVLAENLPDRTAQRPGDIYRARNGKSIHVDNTDAEGRLVLADVLTYAGEQGATHMVDIATLTGACVVALGESVAGLMGRHEDWNRQVREAGQQTGEELWQLPMYGEYRQNLDHPHADINNIGGRYAGTITASQFLAEFVAADVRWAHLDIAGPAIRGGGWRYFAKGMTGFGTRTLARLATTL